MSLKYVQVLDAFDFGDAVSNQVIRIHQMLLEKGEYAEIFSKYADHRVEKYRRNIADFCMDDDTIIIHHYSGYSEITDEIAALRGYKIMVYHNITPHTFFTKGMPLYDFCKKGREQLQQIIHKYNLILGDSPFNCQEAESLGAREVQVLPIIVNNLLKTSISDNLVKDIRLQFDKVWLFVGRIAPNKRQDLLIDVFARYIKLYREEEHHLYLVGRYFEDDPYYLKISSKINELGLNKQVTFAGKIEDQDLAAYYKAADIFLCMSEHEGFCVPIVEAFHAHIPVVAYAETAVADTMGGSPGALNNLDIETAVNQIHSVFTYPDLKNELITHGIQQANRFTANSVRQRLYSIIEGITSRNNLTKPLQVSVVICTCNRSEYLQRCLNYLKDQNYPYFEVIVVNGPSTDNTIDILSSRNDIKVVHNPLRNLSISRNLGIKHAAGDIVAFIDDDALPYDNWLCEIVKRYQEVPNNVVGIGGRTFLANQFQFQFEFGLFDSFGKHIEVLSGSNQDYNSRYYRHLLGTNCTFRKNALLAINGFDEQYDYYLDETDLVFRLQEAGGLIVNANQAYVRHEFAQSHNRQGKYNFNWQVIAKNTAYFGMKNSTKIASLPKRIGVTSKNIFRERCLTFFRAWHHKDLGFKEATYYSYRTIIGTVRGYYDSFFTRRLGHDLSDSNFIFMPYLEPKHTQEEIIKESIAENSKLHILIISQEFPPNSFGGIGAYNQTLTRELMQMGHEVTVISRGPRDCTNVIGPLTHIQVASVENSDSIPQYPTFSKNLAWAKKTAQIAQEIHRQRPISVIESALWDFEGIGILMLRPELKVPLIVRLVTPLLVSIKMNGWQMTEDFHLCMQMEQELIRCADSVIAISNSIQESVVSTYGLIPDQRWLVQPLGVQPWPTYTNVTNYGELPKNLKRGAIQILFVGRLESRKGIDVFLNALKLIMPQDPRISVWIAGADIGGWEEKASQLLDGDVHSRVQFLGMVTEERRELLYANCDFLVFPSRYESFGLVPLEAMVHSKPVIGARAASIPEVIVEGECGLLFEPDNYQDLAEKILTLVNDENLRSNLARGAKQRVEVLSARNMAKASEQIYHYLVQSDIQMQTLDKQIFQSLPNNIFSIDKTEHNIKNILINDVKTSIEQQQLSFNQTSDLNIRSDWSVSKPKIISWGWLNSILNNFIVPKIVKFINSVLFDSMQRQTYVNQVLIASNKALEHELGELKRYIKDEKNNMPNDTLLELKKLMYETQNLAIIQNEMTRSELAYRLNAQLSQEPVIVNQAKLQSNINNLRLNLGCGFGIIPEYINVDQREISGIDVIADISKLPFEEKTISEIFSAHVIEHFTEYDFKNHILPYWYSLLKDGGKIVVICPDAKSMVLDYANGNFPWENLRKVTYGAQDYAGNYHYNMYTPESLCEILSNCGFINATVVAKKRVNGLCYEMEIHAFK